LTSDQAENSICGFLLYFKVFPVKILVLCHEYPPIGGGAATVAHSLDREYATDNSVTVISMGFDQLPAHQDINGIEIFRLPCGRRRKEMASVPEALRWSWKAKRLAQKLHQEEPFDIVHAHFIMPAGIVAHSLKKKVKIPFIITIHGSDVPGYNRERLKAAHFFARIWWKSICRSADRIVAPSDSIRQLLKKSIGGISVNHIPNGFAEDRFQPLVKEKRILLCSRLVERKGIHYFLEAVKNIQLPEWEIDIVGDGPQYDRLAKIALQSKAKVNMLGWIGNDDLLLAELYGKAMIFVFPSEWENSPMVLLEAMGAGCAVITSDIAGNPEIIAETGILVTPCDAAALQKAVIKLTEETSLCAELGDRALRRAKSEYSWSVIAAKYLEILKQLVN
jgi:glycosyltransferase involved in cell wall biosynthesis